ncbi:MAG: MATE family efflux transporter [Myxococcota bacterium]
MSEAKGEGGSTAAGVVEHARPGTRSERLLSTYVREPARGRRLLGYELALVGRIINLGLPVVVGMMTQTAINQIDALMVGRLPEQEAVAGTAALTPALILFWVFGGFLASIQVGTQAVVARRFGGGDTNGAGKTLFNSVWVALLSSLVVTIPALLVVEPYFQLITHDPAVREAGVAYGSVRLIGIFSMVAMQSYKAFYDGVGRVLVFMSIAFLMNLINALLNWLLIFGALGFPKLGVEGAAWSSVISSSAGLVLMVAWTLRHAERDRFRVYRWQNFDLRVAGSVAKLSFFSGLATLFMMTGFYLFFVIVGKIDDAQGLPGINVNATSIIINLCMLVFMTCIAFGTSTATLVSQALGAGNPSLAARYGWHSVKLMVPVMVVVGTVMFLAPETLLRLYLPADAADAMGLKEQVLQVASPALRVCGGLAPLAAAALVLTQALYGAGESRFVMKIELFLHRFCLVPLSWFLAVRLELGLLGCWYAACVYGVSLLVAVGAKFSSGTWQRTEI